MHEKSTPASHATQHGGSAGVAAHAKRTLTVRAYLSAMGTAFGLVAAWAGLVPFAA
jgi:hypothetical protein